MLTRYPGFWIVLPLVMYSFTSRGVGGTKNREKSQNNPSRLLNSHSSVYHFENAQSRDTYIQESPGKKLKVLKEASSKSVSII